MLRSSRSLAATQLSRNTVVEVAESATPVREATLESFRRRNAFLDSLFYDVARVTTAEAQTISPWLAREGALLIVPPTGSGPLALCGTIDAFASKGGTSVRILAVAGVGSSALGSAAFARNVADAFGEPVAAVVSGYGLADLMSEATGGWFWFGTLNRMRHRFEEFDRVSRMLSGTASTVEVDPSLSPATLSLDTRTIMALLADSRFHFSLLTGHSKGNLVLSEALYALPAAARANSGQPWIVTVSAAVAMPPRYEKILDVIGRIDWFGGINCTPGIDIDHTWDMSWHHTNTELPFHLPVRKVFDELIMQRGVRLD